MEGLIILRKLYTNNPIIGYLNINSLRDKITQLREVYWKAPIDLLCIDETKLSVLSQISNFTSNVNPPFRRNRDKNGGRKFMIFIKRALIAERLHALEDSTSQTICLVVAVSKKKWCVTFAYRPPYNSNKDGFFKDVNKSLSNITRKYENTFVVGDLLDINILD